MDYVYKLLENKSKEKLSDEDSEKLELIQIMLNNKNWIKIVDYNTAIEILIFLGISENEMANFYVNLFSSSKNTITEYSLVDDINNLVK